MIFDIFKDKRILITGHTGFKGSWLTLWLAKLGAKVYGYALPPNTTPNNYSSSNISKLLTSECLDDIRDKKKLTEYIHSIKPDCIFHLAAQPIVRKSYAEPTETFDANVMGSIYVMDAVRTMQKPCTVIMITSDKCYENVNKTDGYVETDPMGGYDPYSASKGCAELAIASYRRSFFAPETYGKKHLVNLASVRAGNVIGGGDWAEDRIIPDAVRAVTKNVVLEIRSPNAIRPWQHVLEPLSGYMLLAAHLLNKNINFADGWNFGPKNTANPIGVLNLIKKFYEIWGKGKIRCNETKANLHEATYLTLSSQKAETKLKWKQQWDITQTIERTANWYHRYYNGENARTLCEEDIEEYQKKLEY